MDRLFNLKEWLTVADTARHLSIVFGKEVNEADVLRLGMDGRLRLSVNFVNDADARCSKVVGFEETKWAQCSPEFKANLENLVAMVRFPIPASELVNIKLDDERYLNLGDKIIRVRGVWDLPMIGAERLAVKRAYQNLTGGPDVTNKSLRGAFVEGTDGSLWQLQKRCEPSDFTQDSNTSLREFKDFLYMYNMGEVDAQEVLNKSNQRQQKNLERLRSRNDVEGYFEACDLPEDSVLVFRTAALRKFEQSLEQGKGPQKDPDSLSESERSSLLKLVLGMAVSAYKYDPDSQRNPATGGNKRSISDDLSKVDLSLDADTVRRYLQEAVDRFGNPIRKRDKS